ncbi:hypothetical protein DIPPA_54936 [Diplonema papillatum]|nr:hypothetical protein DIPPA_54936 [Diplonema papillatum]
MLAIVRLSILTFTNLSFLLPLREVVKGRRHFEVFISVAHLVTAILYNTCKATGAQILLTELQWHAMNNIIATTYGMLLLIHLQANHGEDFDMFLRYVAFSAIWIAQEADHYWDAQDTAVVAAVFIICTVGKWVALAKLPPYNWSNMMKGLGVIALTAVIWLVSLIDETDPYGLLHGTAQAGAGFALRYLWAAVPMDRYRKKEMYLPHNYF